ncbi:vitamin K epoxide reductase family protein [Ancylothrix sp. C2]|uniref:vitamin K epoxide reductase family protein n=1 Tax=Ancylothrix sp. D3o TaxID=2953691 RepID=UPI0021BA5AF3|nr:vitamin K epoxide reductase family protein [Ancylothrix sp. D3o]MCT7948216.1 vitamin K epoxide reductase family protein [Ancylothrix sp. D3o]
MARKRSTPWIHRRSRLLMAGIAVAGALETAFLTVVEFAGKASAVCPTSGCEQVLTSPYAKIFGVPLTLFGFLAYATMAGLAAAPLAVNQSTNKDLRLKLENTTWPLMFILATAMVVFSGYLMYILAFNIKAFCPYCLASALFSLSLFVLSLVGRDWDDIGQLFFNGVIVAMVTIIAALGVYANANNVISPNTANAPNAAPGKGEAPAVTTVSGESEIALARHLTQVGAKEYGAFWCPHCYDQKQLFGKEASALLDYVECDQEGKKSRTKMCVDAGIKGYPSWEIKGQILQGVQSLEKLADISGYTGPRNFKNNLGIQTAP